MQTSSQLLSVLSQHIGKNNGVSVQQLAGQLGSKPRHIRKLVQALRNEGGAICAHPKTGYFIAETQEELERYYLKFIEARCMAGLVQISRAKKISLPDYLGQLRLPT